MLAQVNEDFITEVILFVVFIFCGLLFIGLAIPMILRKIPPNPYYGWRTPKAYSSNRIWYQINWYTGRDILVMGVVQVIYNLALLGFRTQVDEVFYQMFLPGNLFILIGGTIIMMIRGFLYLRKL
jgi:uncharacterized membrane protein